MQGMIIKVECTLGPYAGLNRRLSSAIVIIEKPTLPLLAAGTSIWFKFGAQGRFTVYCLELP